MNRRTIVIAVLGLALVAALAHSVLGARNAAVPEPAEPAHSAAEPPARVLTEVGDKIKFHMRLFDSQATLLYSTRATDRTELEANAANWSGLFGLPLTTNDTPQTHFVTDGMRPIPFDGSSVIPVGQTLLTQPVGRVVALPFVGRMTGFNETVVVERERGPFNRTITAPTATLDALGVFNDDGTFQLDAALSGRVVWQNETAKTLRFDVEDGDMLPIRRTAFTGAVTVDEENDRFGFRLDAEPGAEFYLNERCRFGRYVLDPGTYRVSAVDDARVTLERSPTPWPQLIGRDLVMVIEILSIEKENENE